MTTSTKPTLTLSLDLPDYEGVPRNRDGSLPQVTVTVDARDIPMALSALHILNEDVQSLTTGWFANSLTPEEIAELARHTGEGVPASSLAAAERIHSPFLQHYVTVEVDELLDEGVSRHTVIVGINAPSVVLGMQAFMTLTHPARLGVMTGGLS